jgi:hypothetical protein
MNASYINFMLKKEREKSIITTCDLMIAYMSDLSYHDILYRAVGEARWKQKQRESELLDLERRQELVDAVLLEQRQEYEELTATVAAPTTTPIIPEAPYSSSAEAIAAHEAESQRVLRQKRQEQLERQTQAQKGLAQAAESLRQEELAVAMEKLRKANQGQQPEVEGSALDNATTLFEEQ